MAAELILMGRSQARDLVGVGGLGAHMAEGVRLITGQQKSSPVGEEGRKG